MDLISHYVFCAGCCNLNQCSVILADHGFLIPDEEIAASGRLVVQGWGLLNQFPPFRYFPNFSSLSKHTLTVKYRVYI